MSQEIAVVLVYQSAKCACAELKISVMTAAAAFQMLFIYIFSFVFIFFYDLLWAAVFVGLFSLRQCILGNHKPSVVGHCTYSVSLFVVSLHYCNIFSFLAIQIQFVAMHIIIGQCSMTSMN